MKRFLLFSAALLVIAVPALAGSGEKCSQNAQACINHWSKSKTMGYLGLKYDKAEDGTVSVKEVVANGPAAAAGIQVGDVLVAMNGAKMSDKAAVKKAKGDWKVGQSVSYTIMRAGEEKQVAVTLGTTPEEVFASMVGSHMLENHVTAATAAAGYGEAKESKK